VAAGLAAAAGVGLRHLLFGISPFAPRRHECAEDFGKSAPYMRTPSLLMISENPVRLVGSVPSAVIRTTNAS